MQNSVLPWLEQHAPWIFNSRAWVEGSHDPAVADEETDIEQSPLKELEKHIPRQLDSGTCGLGDGSELLAEGRASGTVREKLSVGHSEVFLLCYTPKQN
jgi:hypothetical protein